MIEANPESLLIYRELLEHVQKACYEMNRDYAFILRKTYFEPMDPSAIARMIDVWDHQMSILKEAALQKIRIELSKAGFIEWRKTRNKKGRNCYRYFMNRAEYYEPTEARICQ